MSTDKATRDASLAATDRINQWSVDANMRVDVYEALKAFNKTPEAKALKGEQARFFTFALRDARRSGLDLPKDKRDELSALLKKMATIKLDFSACLTADTTHLSFLPSELNGTTKEFVAGLKRDPNNTNKARFTRPGLVIVTVKYPDYYPIIQECTVESTRKQMEFAYNNVCADTNTKRLDDLVALRAKVAAILGYANWAAYTQETLMAKNPERVMKFLTELRAKLVKLRDQQYDVLLQYKRQEKEAQGKKFDGIEKRDFSVDKQEVQQYFPIAYVVPKLLDVYQELLGLRFQLDTALSKAAWAPGVEAYKVFDAKSKELLGIFYLDLHPREGKFGHAAMFGLQPPSWIQVGGKTEKLIGVGSLMCNFPDDTPTQPGLLPHDDVTTLFHEMGHMFHQILGRTKIASFAGTSTDTDFVEAPSQMLENWTWEPEVLRRITKHHKTGKIMPEHLIAKLVKSRVANAGISNMKQLAYGLYDQKVHTSTNISTADTYIQ
ncbi:thimet oligopeptidase 1, partial [Monoraphidium neglectum]